MPIEYERKTNMRIRNGFEEFFCLRSSLSNDDIISASRPGLKTGMDFRGLVWKRVWKITFFGLKSGHDLGGTPLPRILRSTSPLTPGRWKSVAGKVKIEKWARHNAHYFTAYDMRSSLAMSSSCHTVRIKGGAIICWRCWMYPSVFNYGNIARNELSDGWSILENFYLSRLSYKMLCLPCRTKVRK